MDFLRAQIFTGFPWNLWAYTWSWSPELLQTLPIIGFFSFNFFCIAFYCSPLLLGFGKKNYKILFLLIAGIFFTNYIYGSSVIKQNNKYLEKLELNSKNSIFTKIVSPNFDLKYNLSNDNVSQNILNLIKYSEAEKNKKTLFVWPEGVFTGFNFKQLTQYRSLFEEAFSENHLILFGVNTINESSPNNQTYNSLIIINNKFDIVYQYDKTKLVPFGEFLPFENILSRIGLKKITDGYGSFSKGENSNIFLLDNLKLLPLICYELIFPELAHNNNEKNLIINISEDAWFGKTIGPDQHFAKAVFRSVENNVFLIRSANKGYSAFIDNKGIIKKILKPNETGVIELNVPLINNVPKERKINLIFYALLFTCVFIFSFFKINEKK